jgi:hypothetical protein
MGLDPDVYLEAAESMLLCGGNMSAEYAVERVLFYPADREVYLREYRKYLGINILDVHREHGTLALLLMAELVR